jgi:hypothetical protein
VSSGRLGERSRINERARAVLPGFDLLDEINPNRRGSLIDKYSKIPVEAKRDVCQRWDTTRY